MDRQNYLIQQLHIAVQTLNEDDGTVRFLIDSGVSVDATTAEGDSPLLLAIRLGRTNMVRDLIEVGADVNFINRRHRKLRSTLLDAAQLGHVEILKLLLDHGADPNLTNGVGSSALYEASCAWRNRCAMLKLLLAHGADMYSGGLGNPSTPFESSVSLDDVAEVQIFLDHGFDLSRCAPRSRSDFSPLHVATRKSGTKMLQLLLSYDVRNSLDLDHVDSFNQSPLDKALDLGFFEHALILLTRALEVGRNIDEIWVAGSSLLERLFFVGNWNLQTFEMMRLVIEAGAEVGEVVTRALTSRRRFARVLARLDQREFAANPVHEGGVLDRDYEARLLESAKAVARYRVLYESRVEVDRPLTESLRNVNGLSRYMEACRAEIEILRDWQFYRYGSFYELLVDRHFYKRLVSDSAFEFVDFNAVTNRAPVYAEDLRISIQRSQEKYEEWQVAIRNLSRASRLDDSNASVFCKIIDYLSESDLRNLSRI